MLRDHDEQPELADPAAVSFREALKQEALRHNQTDIRLPRKLSEESIRTELCEGPVPDSPPRSRTPEQEDITCSDRAELIERIKRGESPTWVPNRHVRPLKPLDIYMVLTTFVRLLTNICAARIAPPPDRFPLSHRQPPATVVRLTGTFTACNDHTREANRRQH